MRQMVVARPFAGGYRSDVPDYALNPNECAFSQDLIYPLGIAQQRWGWSYDGTTADVALNLTGVYRSRYPIPERSLTITSDTGGDLWIHNASSAGTKIWDNPMPASTTWLPRCVYNGELIFCAQDGITPLVRYAGTTMSWSSGSPNGITGNWKMPAGSSTVTGVVGGTGSAVNWPAAAEKSGFFSAAFPNRSATFIYGEYPLISTRILSRVSSTQLTVDSVRNSGATDSTVSSGAQSLRVTPVGAAWPGVGIWDTGTAVSVTGSSGTGKLVSLSGADIASAGIAADNNLPALYGDAILVVNPTDGGPHFMSSIQEVVGQDVYTFGTTASSYSNAQYQITRRLPFKDATVHKNSLWGTGVKQYPNRVYVGPPLWNIGLPPGAVEPFDPSKDGQFADLDELLLTPVDVPSRYDTDPVIALLATPGPLLVLKGASVYGVYGTYPSYEQTILTTGAGCIDLRSAISVDGIAYWAGRDGVFMYAGSQIIPLTRGKIEREWQGLMRGYVAGTSYVSAAVVSGHLVVSTGDLSTSATGGAKTVADSGNPSNRTFIYDLQAQQWTSRISNVKTRNMSSVRVPGEVNSIFAVSDDHQGRVIDLTPTVTGTKCTNRASQTLTDADPIDAGGTGPRMKAWSSASLAGANGIEGEARMLDLTLHTNLYDTTDNAATLTVFTAHGEALDEPSSSFVTHAPISSDTTDRVDRNKRRINRTGRLHQLRIDLQTTSSTTKKTQIPEVVASFRDNRRMT